MGLNRLMSGASCPSGGQPLKNASEQAIHSRRGITGELPVASWGAGPVLHSENPAFARAKNSLSEMVNRNSSFAGKNFKGCAAVTCYA